MGEEKLTIEAYQTLLRQAETENRHLRWKLRLNEATVRSFSLRDVISTVAQIVDGALFLLDKELNVSFPEGHNCLGSALSTELLQTETLRFSPYRSILPQDEEISAGTELDNGDICYCGHFRINTIEPFYLVLITRDRTLEQDIPFLFRTAEECIKTVDLHRKHGDIPFGDFKTLMQMIISGQLQDWDEIDAYLKRLPNPPKRFMSIVIVRIEPGIRNAGNSFAFLTNLRTFFPDCSSMMMDDSFVLLISSNDKAAIQPRPTFREKEFAEFLQENDAFAAISNATQRTDMLRTQYLLAQSTLQLGKSLDPNPPRILFFEDYAEYVLIELAFTRYMALTGHDDFIFLTNPHAVRIYWHDKLNGTNLQTVLYNYCKFNGNVSAAAKASFMHRNTFSAKVAELKKLIPVDLDDTNIQQRMIFSCNLFRFINLYYENNAALSMTDRLNVVALRTQNHRTQPSKYAQRMDP